MNRSFCLRVLASPSAPYLRSLPIPSSEDYSIVDMMVALRAVRRGVNIADGSSACPTAAEAAERDGPFFHVGHFCPGLSSHCGLLGLLRSRTVQRSGPVTCSVCESRTPFANGTRRFSALRSTLRSRYPLHEVDRNQGSKTAHFAKQVPTSRSEHLSAGREVRPGRNPPSLVSGDAREPPSRARRARRFPCPRGRRRHRRARRRIQ